MPPMSWRRGAYTNRVDGCAAVLDGAWRRGVCACGYSWCAFWCRLRWWYVCGCSQPGTSAWYGRVLLLLPEHLLHGY
jgi:hypothetical protein